MKLSSVKHYRCPVHLGPLALIDEQMDQSGEVSSGMLIGPQGDRYPILEGVPQLLRADTLRPVEAATMAEYDRVADDIYDRALDWQFAAFFEDEETVRGTMVDLVRLRPGMRVLEVGCGTGRDSYRLARLLGADGELHMQDLSPGMVRVCVDRMGAYAREFSIDCALEYSVSNGTALPYPDDYFDAVFHFGGFNHFGDLTAAAAELTRVAKPGGRILYGDEAVAPWLKGSEFDAIVCTNNALFKADIPLSSLPACARDASAHWLIANCFYVIAFTKGDGPPPLNLDLPHAGIRGGSMRTRYFGVLEGVTPETKALVRKAAEAAGTSMHEWLDRTIADAAGRILGPADDERKP